MDRSGSGNSTFAAIDLGSNSFHLIVQKSSPHGYITIDRLREKVRLGEGLQNDGTIRPEVRQRACECLDRFRERIGSVRQGNIRAVGTQTFRKAESDKASLTEFETRLGCPIEIVSGVEEARLIWLGASPAISEVQGQVLLIDIGGGSTELVLGSNGISETMHSLEVGCVQVMRTFFPGGELNRRNFQAAKLATEIELEPVLEIFKGTGNPVCVGTSGTILAISKILGSWDKDRLITQKKLRELRKEVFRHDHVQELEFSQVSQDRKKVLPGGMLILEVLMKQLGISSLEAIPGGLREGIIADLVGRDEGNDIREQTIQRKMVTFGVDIPQAQRVSKLAQRILDGVQDSWKLTHTAIPDWIRWSALLHEAGLSIGHESYPRHGEYLIRNSELPGFSHVDQDVMGYLIRFQKKKVFEHNFDGLGPLKAADQRRILVIVRLAVLLNRSRTVSAIPMKIESKPNQISLIFAEDWLGNHPLTQALLEREKMLFREMGLTIDIR